MKDSRMRRCYHVLACVRILHFRRFRKSCKSMLKWFPKGITNHPKWIMGRPSVDLCINLIHFGRCRKNAVFMSPWGAPKSMKLEPRGAKGRQVRHDCSPKWWLCGSKIQGHFARGTTKPKKKGKRNSWWIIRHAVSRWPGEFLEGPEARSSQSC